MNNIVDYTFTKGKFTEDQLESSIIKLFEQASCSANSTLKWQYRNGKQLKRKYDDELMEDILRANLMERYAAIGLTDDEAQIVVNELKQIPSTPLYEGAKKTFWLLNEGYTLRRENKNLPAAHIEYIDYNNLDANDFLIVNQYSVQGYELRRPDLLCFVNGIPVAIWEFKTAIEEDKTVHDAWEQICIRYRRGIPNLLKYCMLAVICDGVNTRLGTPFTKYEYFYAWNKANEQDKVSNGISALYTMIEGAFAPDRLLAILRDFVFFPDDDKHETEIVCRYPQFFAANRMLNHICEHLRPLGDGKGGTYFGATGCGKTYTMLFLARLMILRRTEELGNPTIILLVDRDELDSQTSELFVSAKRFLHESDVRSIETRQDLSYTLKDKPSGGVYITTIQKFCDGTGLLSSRTNIICISDEAHRTQTGIAPHLKKTSEGIFTRFGFAHYLREGFPNATYTGFTGTPIDETIAVFGPVVDRYTMKESSDDGITVRITYEPRLARVQLSDEETKKIDEYYRQCQDEGSNPEQIEASKRAMSAMTVILRNPKRLRKLAADLVIHYETLCNEQPGIVKKAMVVCSDRWHAWDLYREIARQRPDWTVPRKAENESILTEDELEGLKSLPKINLVATRGKDDPKELYDLCGTKEYRAELDRQFKNNDSNFRIAVVCDMWITGFDVPSLAVMYIDKPLQRHTLIQTISRVNRVFEGKDKGIVVDYIGIKENMMAALKLYGNDDKGSIDDLNTTLCIFRNRLALLDDLMNGFDAKRFHTGTPLVRLECLNDAAEYVQASKEFQTRFMGHTRVLKSAYNICFPSGELTDREIATAQFYLAIRSIIYKQTIGNAPDADTMNAVVEDMVAKAISCSGVESIVDAQKSEDIFSDEFEKELASTKMPITKFNALLKLVRKAIRDYGHTNKIKAEEFSERLRKVVDAYNNRDHLQFVSDVFTDFVDNLSDQLIQIMKDLDKDKTSFEKMGITYEEKAFYDVLVKVRDEHGFEYPEDKCIALAKEVSRLVNDKSQYADWSTRTDIKSSLSAGLLMLLYKNGYPPEWNDEVYQKVLEQAENMKKYEDS